MDTCCQHQLFLSPGLLLSIYKPSANLEMAFEFLYVLYFIFIFVCVIWDSVWWIRHGSYTTIAVTAIVQHKVSIYMYSVRWPVITASLLYNIRLWQILHDLYPSAEAHFCGQSHVCCCHCLLKPYPSTWTGYYSSCCTILQS